MHRQQFFYKHLNPTDSLSSSNHHLPEIPHCVRNDNPNQPTTEGKRRRARTDSLSSFNHHLPEIPHCVRNDNPNQPTIEGKRRRARQVPIFTTFTAAAFPPLHDLQPCHSEW